RKRAKIRHIEGSRLLGRPSTESSYVQHPFVAIGKGILCAPDQSDANPNPLTCNVARRKISMTIIKVVEPHAILRLGLLQLIANVVPDVKIEGADYAAMSGASRDPRDIDLVLLSISPAEDT